MTDHIPDATKKVGRPQIREVFLRNGFTITPDRDDLEDRVYEAAFELLELAAPAVQGEPVLDAPFGGILYLQVDGKPDQWRRINPCKLYTAPQPAEQKPFEWPLLDAPALIGGVVVGKGCSSGHVVMIAQRKYQYEAEHSPEEHARRKKAFQDALAQIRDGVGQQPDEAWSDDADSDSAAVAEAIRAREEAIAQVSGLQLQVAGLVEALESLIKGYVSLLEAGMDRITSLGGDCDPVPVMEQNDPWLRDARAALAAHRKQGSEA